MSHVTFVISDLACGGAQRVLTRIANAFCEKGYSITVITFSDPSEDFFGLHPAIVHRSIYGLSESGNVIKATLANLARIWKLRKLIRGSQSPIVVGFVSTTNILVILACLGLKVKVFISERNDPAKQSLGRIWDGLRRWIYPWADIVTANSKGVIENLSTFVHSEKLAYVPNPIVIQNESTSGAAATLHKPCLLAVGRLHWQKGYDILLKSFAALAPHYPEWKLYIVGKGGLQSELEVLSNELKLTNRVIWVANSDAIEFYYKNADIFVLASRHEGMPNVLLEAMAYGLPAIVTDASPGPLEYVTHEETGLVVPAEDVEAMSNAIRRLISDHDLRNEIAQNAQHRVSELLLPNAIEAWEKVFHLI